jgi:hypothetical protein
MSTIGLSPVAAFVLRSLHDHPELRLPEAIVAEAEDSPRPLDVEDVNNGLAELESKGLAEEEQGRGWRLTDGAR